MGGRRADDVTVTEIRNALAMKPAAFVVTFDVAGMMQVRSFLRGSRCGNAA